MERARQESSLEPISNPLRSLTWLKITGWLVPVPGLPRGSRLIGLALRTDRAVACAAGVRTDGANGIGSVDDAVDRR
jgi:hypothetical protein